MTGTPASAPRGLTVLLYHGITPRSGGYGLHQADLERQLAALKRRYDVVGLDEAMQPAGRSRRHRVLITFDDGFRNNAEVAAPVLRAHDLPAVFFISSRHAEPGKYLWFAYLQALQRHFPGDHLVFRGERLDFSAAQRTAAMSRLRELLLSLTPHPVALYRALEDDLPRLEDFVPAGVLQDDYAGMTPEQVASLGADPRFSIGVHTVDHPLLSRCEPEEARRQIRENRAWLEAAAGRPAATIAYPGGDYDAATLHACREEGLEAGFAVIEHLGRDPLFEIPRMGIYRGSVPVLRLKVRAGAYLRKLGARIG